MKKAFAKVTSGEERWSAYSKVLDRLQTEKRVRRVLINGFRT
jgi:hypothetical protein